MEETLISTRELAQMIGVTERNLQWWAERGILRQAQAGSGCARQWNAKDATRARQVGHLRARNFPLKAVRKILSIVGTGHQGWRYLCFSRGRFTAASDAEAAIRRAVDIRGPIQLIQLPGVLRDEDLIAFKERRSNAKLKQYWAVGAS